MADGTLIKAHQQPTLLRRPRPPKVIAKSQQLNNGTKISPRKSPRNKQQTEQNTYSHDVYANTKIDFQIHSLYPKGPSFFPPGKKFMGHRPSLYSDDEAIDEFYGDDSDDIVHTNESAYGVYSSSDYKEGEYYQDEGEFTLRDFRMSAEMSPRRRLLCEQGGKVISRQNYLKLTGWFANNMPTQESLNRVSLDVGVQPPDERKPRHQALLELQSMVNEAMMMSPSTTSIGFEDTVQREPSPSPNGPEFADQVFRSSTSRYFCGQGRSNSPFDSSDQPQISPSEVAILDCMMSGGSQLSLKAHFISELPDLSPLSCTLTYVNISFNSLSVFPPGLFQLPHLVCLKMRNNPIKEIPNEITNLTKLRVLCVSFNLLTDLPAGLFDLQFLHDLDVSYNTLYSLSRNISRLVNLRKLNVEGNQLVGLPSTSLTLPLVHLLVGDNLMHPILWRENTRNQPQELVDLCSMTVSKYLTHTVDSRLPAHVMDILQSHTPHTCDNCQRPVYGCGLRVIRGVCQEVFGIKNLPFVFQVCSPSCRAMLKRKPNNDWTKLFQQSLTNTKINTVT